MYVGSDGYLGYYNATLAPYSLSIATFSIVSCTVDKHLTLFLPSSYKLVYLLCLEKKTDDGFVSYRHLYDESCAITPNYLRCRSTVYNRTINPLELALTKATQNIGWKACYYQFSYCSDWQRHKSDPPMPPSLPSRGFARAVLSNPASKSTHPTPTSTSTATSLVQKIHDFASRTLHPRLETDVSTVPEGYGRNQNGPDAGTVVGIVLGSVAGFILLFWIIYWCVNLGNPTVGIEEGSVGGGGSSSVVSYRSRPRAHRGSHHHSHSSRQYSPRRRTKETIEITRRDRSVRRSLSPSPARAPDPEQIVVMEEHSRSRSRSVSRPRPPPTDGDDEIIVLEEHTPPRRRDSRGYRRRSSERRSSAQYRDVDYRFSGGDGPPRTASRRGSSSRR
ncbi:hypothetical protein F5Y04DRAFT_240746 [Hypomontagnella monticulosa]|nr:hypothetical protein F5Y04DRAFT_240746 [Hypomontagnella monticulosa]